MDVITGKKPFNVLVFVLFSIVMACGIFVGLITKQIPPVAAGLSLLLFVAIPHIIGLFLSIKHGHTEAGLVIGLFALFWCLLSASLLLAIPGLHQALLYIEPPMFLLIFRMVGAYKKQPSLAALLGGLGATVTILWLAKLIEPLESWPPYVVTLLGLWVLFVASNQLSKHQLSTS